MPELNERLAEIQAIQATWKEPLRRTVENPLAMLCEEHLRKNRRDVLVAQSQLNEFRQSLVRAKEITRWMLDPQTPMPFHEVCRVLDLDCREIREQLTRHVEPGLVGLMGLAVQFQCPCCGGRP